MTLVHFLKVVVQSKIVNPGMNPRRFITEEKILVNQRIYRIENLSNSTLDELVVTDTVPLSEAAEKCPKIRQLSVAGLLGESINRITSGQSLSSMFVD